MPIDFCIICGCVPATVAELSGYDWDYMTLKAENIYYLDLYRESFLIPALEEGYNL